MTKLLTGYEASSKGIIKDLERIIKQNPSWDDISDTFSTAYILAIIASGEEGAYVWDKILKWITMAGTDKQKQILIKQIVVNTEAIDICDKIPDLINTIEDKTIKSELNENILQSRINFSSEYDEEYRLRSALFSLTGYESRRIPWLRLSELIQSSNATDLIFRIFSPNPNFHPPFDIKPDGYIYFKPLFRVIYNQRDPVIWDIILNLIKMTSSDQQKGILKMIFSDYYPEKEFIKSIYLHDPMFLKTLEKLLINLAIDEELRQECIAKLFHADLFGNSTLIATMLQEQPDVSDVIEIIIDLILLGNADKQLGLIKQVFNKAKEQVHPRIFYKLAKDALNLARQLFNEKYGIRHNYSDYFNTTIQNIDPELPLPADFYEQIKKLVEFMPTNELRVVDQTPKEVEGVELFSLYDIRYEDILDKLRTLVDSDITSASIVRTLLMRVTLEWENLNRLFYNEKMMRKFVKGPTMLMLAAKYQKNPEVWEQLIELVHKVSDVKARQELVQAIFLEEDKLGDTVLHSAAFGASSEVWQKILSLFKIIDDDKTKQKAIKQILIYNASKREYQQIPIDSLIWEELTKLLDSIDNQTIRQEIINDFFIEFGMGKVIVKNYLRYPKIWGGLFELIKNITDKKKKQRIIKKAMHRINETVIDAVPHQSDIEVWNKLVSLIVNAQDPLKQQAIKDIFNVKHTYSERMGVTFLESFLQTAIEKNEKVDIFLEIANQLISMLSDEGQLELISTIFKNRNHINVPRFYSRDNLFSTACFYGQSHGILKFLAQLIPPTFSDSKKIDLITEIALSFAGISLRFNALKPFEYREVYKKKWTTDDYHFKNIIGLIELSRLEHRPKIIKKLFETTLSRDDFADDNYKLAGKFGMKLATLNSNQKEFLNTIVELIKMADGLEQEIIDIIWQDSSPDNFFIAVALCKDPDAWDQVSSLINMADEEKREQLIESIYQDKLFSRRPGYFFIFKKIDYLGSPVSHWEKHFELIGTIKDIPKRLGLIQKIFEEARAYNYCKKNTPAFKELVKMACGALGDDAAMKDQLLQNIFNQSQLSSLINRKPYYRPISGVMVYDDDFFYDYYWDNIFELFEIASPNQQLQLIGRVFENTSQTLSADVYVELAKKIINTEALESELVTADEQAILQHFSDIQLQSVKKAFDFTDKELHPKIFYELAQNAVLAETLFREKSGLFTTYQDIFIDSMHRILDNSYELPQAVPDNFLEQLILLAQNTDDETGLSDRLQVKSYFPRLNCKELNQSSVLSILHNKKPCETIYRILFEELSEDDINEIDAIHDQFEARKAAEEYAKKYSKSNTVLELVEGDNSKNPFVNQDTIRDLFRPENSTGDDNIGKFLKKFGEDVTNQNSDGLEEKLIEKVNIYIMLTGVIGRTDEQDTLYSLQDTLLKTPFIRKN